MGSQIQLWELCFSAGRPLTLGEPCSDSWSFAEERLITPCWLLLSPVAGLERTHSPRYALQDHFVFCPEPFSEDPQPVPNIKQPCASGTPSRSCSASVLTPYFLSVSSPEVKYWGRVWQFSSVCPRQMCTAQCLVLLTGTAGFLPSWLHPAIAKPRAGEPGGCQVLQLCTCPCEGLSHASLALSRCSAESRWPDQCSLERAALAVPWQQSPPTVAQQGQGSLGLTHAQAVVHAPGNNLKPPGAGDMYPLLCFPLLQAAASGGGNNTLNCNHPLSYIITSSVWRADPLRPGAENRLLPLSSPLFVHHWSLGFWQHFFRLYLGTGEHCACLLPVSFVCSFPFYTCLE